MDDIKAWLNDPSAPYAQGVQLLVAHHPDAAVRRLFLDEDETHYKRTRLKKELLGLLTPPKATEAKEPAPMEPQGHKYPKGGPVVDIEIPTRPDNPHKGWHHPSLMDEVERALFLKWKPLQAERKHLMATIYEVGRAGITNPAQEAEAGRMALRILDLRAAVNEIYKDRDEYFRTGILPTVEVMEDVVDYRKWPKMLANAQRYAREAKGKLKKDPANTAAAAQLAKWQKEVDKYKKLLDGE